MYVDITIDLKNYNSSIFDLRISNYHSIRTMIDMVWQVQNLMEPPRDGYWIRVDNKEKVHGGYEKLIHANITSGDRIEIL
ncbi:MULTISPECIES: EsaB/YukD family protein [Rummeliibacillus]|uniref:EsaB/YukD family protein n=1 Tax=Rummeliibacillus TaxID=648802 RepID=UPI0011B82CCF|nr:MULTISPECIES: EsaB/YukD family protein [Rummeliibacillus]MBO2535948.1 ubiquitin [Rummeliibacillus suwonensis]